MNHKDRDFNLFVLRIGLRSVAGAVRYSKAIKSTVTRKEAWKEFGMNICVFQHRGLCFRFNCPPRQGSTFDNVFVSYRDINRNPVCLSVISACTLR